LLKIRNILQKPHQIRFLMRLNGGKTGGHIANVLIWQKEKIACFVRFTLLFG
jgi:hypothetical protein